MASGSMRSLSSEGNAQWRGGVTSGAATSVGMSRGDMVAMAARCVLETELRSCLGSPKSTRPKSTNLGQGQKQRGALKNLRLAPLRAPEHSGTRQSHARTPLTGAAVPPAAYGRLPARTRGGLKYWG